MADEELELREHAVGAAHGRPPDDRRRRGGFRAECDGATTLLLSKDRGATFAPITNGGKVFSGNGRTTLAVGAPGDNVVYAYSSDVGDLQMKDVYGAGPLTISFRHRFSFENGGWDGGVVESSKDGGATWVDVGTAAYNGSINPVTTSPSGINRRAFVNRSAGWPNFGNVALNLGTAFANQDIKVRFRIGADESTGAPGWDIDDISFGGITDAPFSALVENARVCSAVQASR